MKKSLLVLKILIFITCNGLLYGQFELAGIFSDHMVIQRDLPINVWGNAESGTQVSVTFNNVSYSTQVLVLGMWTIQLPAMKAGGPYNMEVHNGESVISLSDIYIGDVWICSGQSNMEWTVELSDGAEKAKKEANDPLIRHFKVAHSYADEPDYELADGVWEIAGPETVADFTAVGYYFATELREHARVPVGLINTSWGGSRIEAWMSKDALGIENPGSIIDQYYENEKRQYELVFNDMKQKFPGLSTDDKGLSGEEPVWARTDLQEDQWVEMTLPGIWESQGYNGFDGVGWYRKRFKIAQISENVEVEISLAKIDDSDQVWVNGIKVGGLEKAWDKNRNYTFPGSYLHEGDNVIAIRVEDTGGGGGVHGNAGDMYLKMGTDIMPLSGEWLFRPGAILGFTPRNNVHHTPTMLYNKMIHPLISFPIKGAIWYQGESNAGNAEDATMYADQFKSMIKDWRYKWGIGSFPFIYVQLANFMTPPKDPAESNWAILRESQTQALSLENVGEAVIIDIGEADDIHPGNKKDVGYRLVTGCKEAGIWRRYYRCWSKECLS
jgi:sialate O-acetylesterase